MLPTANNNETILPNFSNNQTLLPNFGNNKMLSNPVKIRPHYPAQIKSDINNLW